MERDVESTAELKNSCHELDFERFDFLSACLKTSEAEFGLDAKRIRISCFDVNENYFIFGTNSGLIYCLRRRVFNTKQLFKYRLISNAIHIIRLITDELLSFATESNVYVLNRVNRKFLYGWKCPTKAVITCLQTYMSLSDHKLLIISGDSEGYVRHHSLTGFSPQQNVIFKDIGFQIIQLEFIDSQTLLISTTLKTVVVECDFSDPNQQIERQIGKNERKSCGKFGAVYSHKNNIIYGSRPSMHLIKAEPNGNVIETIRINNIEQTECPQRLEELAQKPISGQTVYKLGVLKLFCDDQYLISTNDSNLLIIGTDGQFCMKEKIEGLIEVKTSANNSNEAFLLLESKHIIRIRNNRLISRSDFEVSSESDRSSETEEKVKTNDKKSSTESLFNKWKGPAVNVNSISFIEEELKKAFDFKRIQNKITKKYNELSSSIISTIDPNVLPDSDKNGVFVTPIDSINDSFDSNSPTKENPDFVSPLVVTRKGKRRTHHNSSDSIRTVSSDNLSINGAEQQIINTESNEILTENLLPKTEISVKTIDILSENHESNDDNRLTMILSAYKEANNKIDSICGESETEINETSDSMNDNQTESNEIVLTDTSETKGVTERQRECERQTREPKESENSYKPIDYKWEQMFRLSDVKAIKSYSFVSFCAMGYNCSTEIGLIWFVPRNQTFLIYYPSFDSLKLNKVQVSATTCATYELYVLTDSGNIFKREGMDATKPVGTKWTQIRANKSRAKITSISLCAKQSILWCCDQNGETWTHESRGQKWWQIKDFSSHSIEMKKVSVCPIDATIVWGIDRNGKIFVRVFHTSSDSNEENDLCGEEWHLIDGILAEDLVVCNDYNVIIIVEPNQLFGRKATISPNDRINEWKGLNGPDIPNDTYTSISVTEDNEIFLMTAKGSVWQTYRPSKRNSAKEDLDWLLI